MLIVKKETRLSQFNFWCCAKERAALLTADQLDAFGEILEELYPTGIYEGVLNDIMWFDFDWVCEVLGIPNPEYEDATLDEDEESVNDIE